MSTRKKCLGQERKQTRKLKFMFTFLDLKEFKTQFTDCKSSKGLHELEDLLSQIANTVI